jgi:hypothetical protein
MSDALLAKYSQGVSRYGHVVADDVVVVFSVLLYTNQIEYLEPFPLSTEEVIWILTVFGDAVVVP